ncbi:hypothetical protein HZC08_01260 [Candidatus Micrarchaeota archaeon]|nr:hypothetical protein [Candidatus Micrarchaeota archaeon]
MAKADWQKILKTADMKVCSDGSEETSLASGNPQNSILYIQFQLSKNYSVIFYFDQNPIIQGLLPKEKEAARDLIIHQINGVSSTFFTEVVLEDKKNDAELTLYERGEQRYSKKELLKNGIAEPEKAFSDGDR